MSYLGPLRLHFAGRFQASVSTVNNEATNFDNETFVPADQEQSSAVGWWNPRGDADWRLIDCKVTSAWLADGSAAAADDPVMSTTVADSDRLPPAKLVDLDPCQQLVSTIWGLEMRIADGKGNTLMRGQYEPTAFFDIWHRGLRGGGVGSDFFACAMYQSVLKGVSWGDVSASPFLTALREATPDGLLSVNFSVDGYSMNPTDPEFTRGRIVGTIGPSNPTEPAHMTLGRHLVAEMEHPGSWTPAHEVNTCIAVVDEATAKVYLDLGNALPTETAGGEIAEIGKLSLRAGNEAICPVPYSTDGWYARTAGIAALPEDRSLSAAELQRVAESPLSLWVEGAKQAAVAETPDYARADGFVFRLDPGDSATVRFHASRLGKPLPATEVKLQRDPGGLQPPPEVAVPESAISFPATVRTDADGVAEATVTASDPGSPRVYVDGQVYGVRPTLGDDPSSSVDQWNFVSLLVWSDFQHAEPPTWLGDLQPIFQQYANLYPIMRDFLDLSSYEDVCANRKLLLLAFDLDIADPNSMPVTRDLSTKKREAILAWLKSPDEEGNLLLGEAAPPSAPVASAQAKAPIDPMIRLQGGKTAAAARRLSVIQEAP